MADQYVISAEWMRAHASPRGGWSYRQLAVLGVVIPLPKGWLKALPGTSISSQQREAFEALAVKGPSTVKHKTTKLQQKAKRRLAKMQRLERKIASGPVTIIKFPQIKSDPQTHPDGQPIAHAPRPPCRVDPSSPEFLNSYAWRQLRMKVLMHYGARCQCCGASPSTGAVMNVDHIKPRKLFPRLALDFDNLQVLCGDCNAGKGNWAQTDWRQNLSSTHDPVTEDDVSAVAHLRDILAG